jgi:hypothetical protein
MNGIDQKRTRQSRGRLLLLFVGSMILAGATKSDGIIGIFWFTWLFYWSILLYKRISTKKPMTLIDQTNNDDRNVRTLELSKMPKTPTEEQRIYFQKQSSIAPVEVMKDNSDPEPKETESQVEQISPSEFRNTAIIDVPNIPVTIPQLLQPLPEVCIENPEPSDAKQAVESPRPFDATSGMIMQNRTGDFILHENDFVGEVPCTDEYFSIWNGGEQNSLPIDFRRDKRLGLILKHKMSLSSGQIRWLNMFEFYVWDEALNNDECISFCSLLYLNLLKKADDHLQSQQSSLREELLKIGAKWFRKRKEMGFEWLVSVKYAQEQIQASFARTLFYDLCLGSIRNSVTRTPLVNWSSVFYPSIEFFKKDLVETLKSSLAEFYADHGSFSASFIRTLYESRPFLWKKQLLISI